MTKAAHDQAGPAADPPGKTALIHQSGTGASMSGRFRSASSDGAERRSGGTRPRSGEAVKAPSPTRWTGKPRPSRRPCGPPQDEVFLVNQCSRPHAEERRRRVSKHAAGRRAFSASVVLGHSPAPLAGGKVPSRDRGHKTEASMALEIGRASCREKVCQYV